MTAASSSVCCHCSPISNRVMEQELCQGVTLGKCMGEGCTHQAGSWGPRAVACCTELRAWSQKLVFCSECAAIRLADATFAWRVDRSH